MQRKFQSWRFRLDHFPHMGLLYFFRNIQNDARVQPFELHCEKNLFAPYTNNKGTYQPAHQRSLMSTFVVCCLDSITPLVVIWHFKTLAWVIPGWKPWRQVFSWWASFKLVIVPTFLRSSLSTSASATVEACPACISRHGNLCRWTVLTLTSWNWPSSNGPNISLSPSRIEPLTIKFIHL